METMADQNLLYPGVYHSFDSVLKVLNSDKYRGYGEVKALISIYEEFKLKEKDIKSTIKRKPFIVLEGMDGCGKSTTSRDLATSVEGKVTSTPPSCLLELRTEFDRHGQELRRAYYAMGNYIAACEVRLATAEMPLVMDRFWHSTVAYCLANMTKETGRPLPGESDPVYSWPSDLLRPDAVFFLDVSEETRRKRLSSRKAFTPEEEALNHNLEFRNNLMTAYKRMRDPCVTVIDSNGTVDEVVQEINTRISRLPNIGQF